MLVWALLAGHVELAKFLAHGGLTAPDTAFLFERLARNEDTIAELRELQIQLEIAGQEGKVLNEQLVEQLDADRAKVIKLQAQLENAEHEKKTISEQLDHNRGMVVELQTQQVADGVKVSELQSQLENAEQEKQRMSEQLDHNKGMIAELKALRVADSARFDRLQVQLEKAEQMRQTICTLYQEHCSNTDFVDCESDVDGTADEAVMR